MGQLRNLCRFRGQNSGTPTTRTEDDFKSSARRDDECGCLVIVGKAVGIWTDFFGCFGVVVCTTGVWSVVFADTAVLVTVVLGTSRVTGVESRPLNVAVRIGIHTVSRCRGGVDLQIPRTPAVGITRRDLGIERQGISGVCPEKSLLAGVRIVV